MNPIDLPQPPNLRPPLTPRKKNFLSSKETARRIAAFIHDVSQRQLAIRQERLDHYLNRKHSIKTILKR